MIGQNDDDDKTTLTASINNNNSQTCTKRTNDRNNWWHRLWCGYINGSNVGKQIRDKGRGNYEGSNNNDNNNNGPCWNLNWIEFNRIKLFLRGESYQLPCLNMSDGGMCVILLVVPFRTRRLVWDETSISHHHQTKPAMPPHITNYYYRYLCLLLLQPLQKNHY